MTQTPGPISSLSVLGQTMIIINDAQLASELLNKHSAIHSCRPKFQFASMLASPPCLCLLAWTNSSRAGWDQILGTAEYSDRFRAMRKALHQEIGSTKSVARFNSVQEVEVRRFLLRVLDGPDDLINHLRKYVTPQPIERGLL